MLAGGQPPCIKKTGAKWPRTPHIQHNAWSVHTGEQAPRGQGHRTHNAAHQECTPGNIPPRGQTKPTPPHRKDLPWPTLPAAPSRAKPSKAGSRNRGRVSRAGMQNGMAAQGEENHRKRGQTPPPPTSTNPTVACRGCSWAPRKPATRPDGLVRAGVCPGACTTARRGKASAPDAGQAGHTRSTAHLQNHDARHHSTMAHTRARKRASHCEQAPQSP